MAGETHTGEVATGAEPLLLPKPQRLSLTGGQFALASGLLIHLQRPSLLKLGQIAQRMLAETGTRADLSANPAQADQAGLRLVLNQALTEAEGYLLNIGPAGIRIEAQREQGLFYGLMSLKQLLRQYGRSLPALAVRDWPDFAARGAMLDISRDKVPRLETLYMLIDHLSEWKLNQLQLYTEHTYAYAGHETVWAEASPLSSEDVLLLDAYCAERYIELVPNQNSFGHLTRWLKHEPYARLAETGPEGFLLPWSDEPHREPFSLCPQDPGSIALLRDLYHQLLPQFSSGMVNIGADETFDLGQGRSREACEREGKGKVYLGFLRQLHELVSGHGRLMQFWGDIILHEPALIPELPRPCLALDWGYEADHPFETEAAQFAAAGVPFYVCPGTSAWNSLGGRSDTMRQNLRAAAEAGRRHGAVGYLVTDWGDNGHWQPLPVSLPGLACAAAEAWAGVANENLALGPALDAQVFCDPAGISAEAWLELGTVYRLTGCELFNRSLIFTLLYGHRQDPAANEGLMPESLRACEHVLETLIARSAGNASQRPDAALIRDEFALAAGLMRHSCRLAAERLETGLEPEALPARQALAAELAHLITEYRRIWLSRNRPGGLSDSLRVLEDLLGRYRGDGEAPADVIGTPGASAAAQACRIQAMPEIPSDRNESDS